MGFNILTIPPFDKQLKRLAKKYPSIKNDFATLLDDLTENPNRGSSIGKNCFKIRLAIKSKGKGKSGGARVITNFAVIHESVYLLSIYDKSEKENISDQELKELLESIPD
ncbi:MAG: type II toxin-antitoxin system RelE/ParE family toxin [Bacteroidota bacterium]